MRQAVIGVLALIIANAAPAHHSFAVFFDTDSKLTKVSGVVEEFHFSNPHGIIAVRVSKGRGTTLWRAETNSPSVLRRHGWTPQSLHVGDKVVLEGWPARDGTQYIRMRSAHLADGTPVGQPLGAP